ncbi:hypothetical protein [Bradyrhizobium embrapense]|nr:hypothetical protein [Bradyrhizobium embrapense]
MADDALASDENLSTGDQLIASHNVDRGLTSAFSSRLHCKSQTRRSQ